MTSKKAPACVGRLSSSLLVRSGKRSMVEPADCCARPAASGCNGAITPRQTVEVRSPTAAPTDVTLIPGSARKTPLFMLDITLSCSLAARGETPAAFGRRCIPPPPQRGCRVGGPGLAALLLGATLDFHHVPRSRCSLGQLTSVQISGSRRLFDVDPA